MQCTALIWRLFFQPAVENNIKKLIHFDGFKERDVNWFLRIILMLSFILRSIVRDHKRALVFY